MKNKKVILYYFSGTGNTRLCAYHIAEHFKSLGWDVTLFEYFYNKINNIIDPSDYDLIGFGYPIHAFNPPEVFYKFLKLLPICNKKYFIFKTSGEPFALNSASSYKSYRLLKRKKYEYIMEHHFIMPYNIMFRYKDEVVKQQYMYLDPLCNMLVKRLANGEIDKPHFNLFYIFVSFILRIEWLAPKINAPFCKIKPYLCNECKICLNSCPTHAIYINKNGQIKFNKNCSLCMRCVMNCPTNAIEFGIMDTWKVTPKYDFEKIKKDFTVPDYYINANTKGYFKLFYKYFKKQDELLKKYNIKIEKTERKNLGL